MNMIKQLSIALLLSVIVLASAASAGFMTTLGGTASQSTSDGGNVGVIAQAVYSDAAGTIGGYPVEGGLPDSGALSPATLPAGIVRMLSSVGGQMALTSNEGGMQGTRVLTEGIQSESSVPDGSTGSASSQFVTNGVQDQILTFTPNTLTDPAFQVNTNVDGTVQTSASKTSVRGVADAIATIWASAGVSDAAVAPAGGQITAVGGQGLISSAVQLTGTGTVLAQSSGAANYHASGASDPTTSVTVTPPGTTVFVAAPTDLEAHGGATGATKLSGSNLIGGHIEGWAESSSFTTMTPTIGEGETEETLLLNAQRDISFSGPSAIDGIIADKNLDGTTKGAFETAESSYTPTLNDVLTAAPNSVDLESNSNLDAMARASTRNDHAFTGIDFENYAVADPEADPTGGSAQAVNQVNLLAQTSRDFVETGADKVQAESYVRYADWGVNALSGSTLIPDPSYASVGGSTGLAFDGQTKPSVSGIGVGSWLSHSYTAPVWAAYNAYQEADTLGDQVTGNPEHLVYEQTNGILQGMTISNQVNDAVGFYGDLANQIQTTKVAGVTTSQTQADQDAIEWFEGTNSNVLPGRWNFDPMTPGLSIVTGGTATGRSLNFGWASAIPNDPEDSL